MENDYEDRNFEVILPSQMKIFWQKVAEGSINREVFQAFLNNVSAFTIPRGIYYNFSASQKKAAQILGYDFIGINLVINALQWKGVAIRLTENDLDQYSVIPFFEETLKKIAKRKWRGKRAILWWAPPERYGFNLRKMLEIFGADNRYQPAFDRDLWWLDEDFAEEVIPEGWHITLVEIPPETKSRTLSEQINLKQEYEKLCKPVELVFLSFINLIVNREYLSTFFYSRTDAELFSNHNVSIGKFENNGISINKTSSTLSTQDTPIGLLFSRKLESKILDKNAGKNKSKP